MKFLLSILNIAVFLFGQSAGIPIAKLMGCGRSADLSIEKRTFCCEHFNLDCLAKALNAVQVGNIDEPGASAGHINAKLVRIRTLGEDCKRTEDQCAVGLQCKGGYCLRERSEEHLKALLDRGKLVEEEERGADSGTDEERGDPLPAQKGLILEGQSVKVSDSLTSENSELPSLQESRKASTSGETSNLRRTLSPRKTPTPQVLYTASNQDIRLEGQALKVSQPTPRKTLSPRRTPTPTVPYPANYQDIRVEGQAVKVADSLSFQDPLLKASLTGDDTTSSKSSVGTDDADNYGSYSKEGRSHSTPLMEEEDELAANIADLLAAKLGVSLDSEEMHNIRELIAGTLDERAEREDEVTENIQNQVEESLSKNSEMRSYKVGEVSSRSTREEYTTRYEPLVQCNADAKVNRAKNEMSEAMKQLGQKAERFINVNL